MCLKSCFCPGGIWGHSRHHHRLLPLSRRGGGQAHIQQPGWGSSCVPGFRSNADLFLHNFLPRGGVLTREETTSLTFTDQWSNTIRSYFGCKLLVEVTVTSKSAYFVRTLGLRSGPEAMCCGCIIFSPRFIRQKSSFISPPLPFLPISYNRWPLRGRCITQARLKRHPSFTNQARYETFFNYLDVKMYFFRPFKDERLEEATIGVQLCCRMGEKGGGEGGWHVKLNMVRLDKDKW